MIFSLPAAHIDYEGGYFAIDIPQTLMQDALALFRKNCPNAESYLKRKSERDGQGHFHVTIITPPELVALRKTGQMPKPQDYASRIFHLQWKGIGRVVAQDSEAYFIVVDSPDILAFRASSGLSPVFYPHCTLGFSQYDIHGVPKNKVLWKL